MPGASAARIDVIAPDGTAGSMSPEEFAQRVSLGEKWTTESAEEKKQRKFNEQAGLGTAARVLGENALSGATFGGYDVAAGAIGGEEYKQGRQLAENYAPGAKVGGQVIGALAPLIATGGASTAAEGLNLARGAAAATEAAELANAARGGTAAARGLMGLGRAVTAPGRAVLNLGRAAEGAAAKGIGALGVTGESAAGKALLGAGKMAASGAVEGAAQGAGQAVSETALAPDGDYSKLAERVIAGAKDGALFGAALGGAVGGVSGLGSKFASKMAESAGDLGGLAEKNAAKAIAADGRAATEAIDAGYGTRLLKDDVVKAGQSLDETLAKAQTVKRVADDTIGKTVSVLDDAGRAVETKALQAELSKDVLRPLAKSNPAAAGLLEKELAAITGAERVGFQDLHQLTTNLDSSRIWGSAAAPEALKKGVDKAQSILTRGLDDSVASGLKTLSNDEIHAIGLRRGLATEGTAADAAAHADAFVASMSEGGAARAFAEAQQSSRAAGWAERNILKRAESADTVEQALQLTDSIKGAAGFAAGLMSHGLFSGAALGTATSAASSYLRKHGRSIIADLAYRAGQADLQVASKVRAFVNGNARRAAIGSAVDVDSVLARHGKESRAEAFERTAQAVRNGAGSEPMVVHTEAPQTGDAMKAVIQRGMAFLQTKLPPGQGTPSPFYTPPPPGAETVATFAKYVKAVKDPLSVLDSLNNGTVSPQEIEALQAVYPSMYEQIKSELTNQLVERRKKNPLEHPKKINFGVLFGIETDPSLEHGSYEVIQASYSVTTTQGGQQTTTKVSASGGGAAKLSEAMATRAERLEGQELGI